MSELHPGPPGMTDRLDFELRNIPGVVAIGAVGRRLSIAVTSERAADRARNLVHSRLGDDVEVDTIFPPTRNNIPPQILRAISDVAGVRACSARRPHPSRHAVLEVVVGSVNAADTVHDLVVDALGEPFTENRMHLILEIPLVRTQRT